MKLIVNNNQYKRLIRQQNKENNFLNEWGVYIKDNIEDCEQVRIAINDISMVVCLWRHVLLLMRYQVLPV